MPYMLCPICDKEHDVREVTELSKVKLVSGQTIEYMETYYVCDNTLDEENEFMPAKLMDENLRRAKIALSEAQGKGEEE